MISIERILNVKIKHWRTLYFKPPKAHLVCIVLIMVFVLLNSHLFFTIGSTKYINGTRVDFCFEEENVPFIINFIQKLHLFMYFFLPSLALVISNLTLIFSMKKQLKMVYYNKHVSFVLITRTSRNTSSGSNTGSGRNSRSFVVMRTNQLSVNKTLCLDSLLFIFMTLPTSIVSFFFVELMKTPEGQLVISLADSISLTFNAFNIFVYVLLNKVFRHEFKNFFGKLLCFNQK